MSDVLNKQNMTQQFTVKLSELESRLDPHFYQPVYGELIDKLFGKRISKEKDATDKPIIPDDNSLPPENLNDKGNREED